MLLGALLIIISLAPWLINIQSSAHSGLVFSLIYGVGYIILCNAIITKYSKRKPQYFVRIPRKHIYTVGLISAIVIELFANWVWKLWYYPHFSIPVYFFALFFVLVAYFYFILKGYLAVRAVFVAHIRQKEIKKTKRSYHSLFKTLGLLGSLGFVLGLIQDIKTVHINSSTFFNSYGLQKFNLFNIVLIAVSLVFILEYLEYREREDTFIMHLLQGDWVPLASMVIASLLTSITMEGFNIPLSIWIYTNWPYANISLFSLPLTVLLAWPIQYILLISIYRSLYKRETTRIWY